MGAPDLRTRLALIGVAALVALAGAAVPAQAQRSPEPTEVVDVDDFADRARQWSEARRRAREEALRKAEELAKTRPEPRLRPRPCRQRRCRRLRLSQRPRLRRRLSRRPRPARTRPSSTRYRHGTTEAQWHALRQCESTQNYRAISVSGRYRGAYQFSIRTWDWVAGKHYPGSGRGRPHRRFALRPGQDGLQALRDQRLGSLAHLQEEAALLTHTQSAAAGAHGPFRRVAAPVLRPALRG